MKTLSCYYNNCENRQPISSFLGRHTQPGERKAKRRLIGLTENAGHENDGPSKLKDMKLQDMKLTDQFSRHLQGMKIQDMKMTDQIGVIL